MKINNKIVLALALCGLIAPATLTAQEKKPEKKEHKEHAEHDHAEHADHKVKGPNNGRMIMEVEPHAEFFITKDRKIQITFVDDDGKMVPVDKQKVSIICGERANPTKMKMEIKDGILISSNVIPEGNDYPTVITFKVTPDAKSVREKFNLNMSECPTCDNKEYHCDCDHGHEGHDDHEGHDH
jgi:hypothetical protein